MPTAASTASYGLQLQDLNNSLLQSAPNSASRTCPIWTSLPARWTGWPLVLEMWRVSRRERIFQLASICSASRRRSKANAPSRFLCGLLTGRCSLDQSRSETCRPYSSFFPTRKVLAAVLAASQDADDQNRATANPDRCRRYLCG